MADNVTITQGSGTDIGADEISGVKYQRIKLIHGADGTNDGDVSSANPLPVDLGSNNDVTVTGTVDLGATDNAVLDTIATNTGNALTDTQLRATAVPVSGTVTANAGTNLNTSALALESGGNLASIKTNTDKIPTIGQTTMAGSTPVVLASDQSSIPVNATLSAETSKIIGTVNIASGQSVGITANSSVNVAQMNGVAITMGNGISDTGVQRVTIASDSTGQVIARGPVAIDAAISTNQPVINGGRASTAIPTAMSADNDVQAIWLTRNGATVSTPTAHTLGGATPYKLNSAASTNATSLKASAGQIYSIMATNTNAAVRYLKLYNKASAPTVGTDTPIQVYALPGATTGGGFALSIPVGMEFTTGIAFALTTGAADSDTGAVAANEIIVNITYK